MWTAGHAVVKECHSPGEDTNLGLRDHRAAGHLDETNVVRP
jgi:hypothetical protein